MIHLCAGEGLWNLRSTVWELAAGRANHIQETHNKQTWTLATKILLFTVQHAYLQFYGNTNTTNTTSSANTKCNLQWLICRSSKSLNVWPKRRKNYDILSFSGVLSNISQSLFNLHPLKKTLKCFWKLWKKSFILERFLYRTPFAEENCERHLKAQETASKLFVSMVLIELSGAVWMLFLRLFPSWDK